MNACVQIVSAQWISWCFSRLQFNFFKLGLKSFFLKWRGQCISCTRGFFFPLMGAQEWHGDYSSVSGIVPKVFSPLGSVDETIFLFPTLFLWKNKHVLFMHSLSTQSCIFIHFSIIKCDHLEFVRNKFVGRSCRWCLGKLRLVTRQQLLTRVQPTVIWCCLVWWAPGNQVPLSLFLFIVKYS